MLRRRRLPTRHTITHNDEGEPVFELSKRRWGSTFSLGGGLRDEVGGGGRKFFRHGVEKEVGGRILSAIIEERGE